MAEAEEYIPVTFENSLGETISNDPIFLAQRTLEAAGLGASAGRAPTDGDEAIDLEQYPYADLKGAELKALASERGVDITGLKTVGEVRKALSDADEAAAAEDSDEE